MAMEANDVAVTSSGAAPGVPQNNSYGQLPGAADTSVRDGDIGVLFSDDVIPVHYCVRLLCSKFLLSGFPQVSCCIS